MNIYIYIYKINLISFVNAQALDHPNFLQATHSPWAAAPALAAAAAAAAAEAEQRWPGGRPPCPRARC